MGQKGVFEQCARHELLAKFADSFPPFQRFDDSHLGRSFRALLAWRCPSLRKKSCLKLHGRRLGIVSIHRFSDKRHPCSTIRPKNHGRQETAFGRAAVFSTCVLHLPFLPRGQLGICDRFQNPICVERAQCRLDSQAFITFQAAVGARWQARPIVLAD